MAKPIRVLSVLNKLVCGGHENRLLSLARTIDRSRFEYTVVVVTQDPRRRQDFDAMREAFQAAGINVELLDDSQPKSLMRPIRFYKLPGASLFLFRIVRKLNALIRERQIDVIEAHHTMAEIAAVLSARLTGAKAFLTRYHPPLKMRWPSQLLYGLSHGIVTDSHARARDIEEWRIRSTPTISVIPNGISPPESDCSVEELRRKLGLPIDPAIRVIGQVSGLIPIKGHLVLLDAAKQVLDQEPNTMFLLVGYNRGYDEYEVQVRQKAQDLGIADRVVITGYPGSIGDVWKVIDIHVHATLFDSLPNAILEGMSLGKPAVVTEVGGIPEAVLHEQTGLVVPPNNPDELSQGLIRLLRSPQTAAKLGVAAQKRYQENYRPQVMARSLEDLFLKAAA